MVCLCGRDSRDGLLWTLLSPVHLRSGWLYPSLALAEGFWLLVQIPPWTCRSRELGCLGKSPFLQLGAGEEQEKFRLVHLPTSGHMGVHSPLPVTEEAHLGLGLCRACASGVLLNRRHEVASGKMNMAVQES